MTLPVLLGLGSLAFGLAMAALAGGMVKAGEGTDRYPRKVFHLGVFVGAVPALLLGDFWGVGIYGMVISLIVLGAVIQGPELPFYAALARGEKEGDSHTSILVPLVATALGGLASVLLVGRFAAVGFLVCGLGDAAGEPAGRAWGRHHYRAFPWNREAHTRTLEGSLAVLGAGALGAALALWLLGTEGPQIMAGGLACGTIGAVSEGLSGKGADNFWAQLLPSLMAWGLFH